MQISIQEIKHEARKPESFVSLHDLYTDISWKPRAMHVQNQFVDFLDLLFPQEFSLVKKILK